MDDINFDELDSGKVVDPNDDQEEEESEGNLDDDGNYVRRKRRNLGEVKSKPMTITRALKKKGSLIHVLKRQRCRNLDKEEQEKVKK